MKDSWIKVFLYFGMVIVNMGIYGGLQALGVPWWISLAVVIALNASLAAWGGMQDKKDET